MFSRFRILLLLLIIIIIIMIIIIIIIIIIITPGETVPEGQIAGLRPLVRRQS